MNAVRRRTLACLLAALLAASGCATFQLGTGMQKIWIETRPEGATALILPDEMLVETPAEIRIERRQARTIRIEKPGYCRETIYLDRVATPSRDLNLLFLLLAPVGVPLTPLGYWVDERSGAAYRLRPDRFDVYLWPADSPDRECGSASSRPRRPGERLPTPEPL